MNVGEVWVLRCVGIEMLCLILAHVEEDDGIIFLDLETGKQSRWHSPIRLAIGDGIGQWYRWESC